MQLKAAAPEELGTGYPAEGRGVLAGCPGWPGSRGPKAGVAGRGASPIQLHQQSVGQVLPPLSTSAPNLQSCAVPSHVLFAPRHVPAPDRAGVGWCRDLHGAVGAGAGCSRLAVLGPCWKRGRPLIHIVLAVLFLLSSPGLTPLFFTAGLFFFVVVVF